MVATFDTFIPSHETPDRELWLRPRAVSRFGGKYWRRQLFPDKSSRRSVYPARLTLTVGKPLPDVEDKGTLLSMGRPLYDQVEERPEHVWARP